jgi:hypothetical protein
VRRLSIRARLALWYGAVMVVVLLVLAVAVSWVHQRVVIEGIDEHLQGSTWSRPRHSG